MNLTPRSTRALDDIVERSGDSKTDIINRALQIFAYLDEITHRDGAIYIRDGGPEAELERLRIF